MEHKSERPPAQADPALAHGGSSNALASTDPMTVDSSSSAPLRRSNGPPAQECPEEPTPIVTSALTWKRWAIVFVIALVFCTGIGALMWARGHNLFMSDVRMLCDAQ
jgi:hypothetical protein